MSNLLFDEHPLVISPGLAKAIGLNEAIILQQIHYWIRPERKPHMIDGTPWIYNSLSEWLEQFPFWSESTIYRALKSLEDMGAIRVGNFNKRKGDRTNWYTINYGNLDDVFKRGVETPSRQNETGSSQNGTPSRQNGTTLPETTTEITTETTTNIYSPPKRKKSPLKEKPKAQPPAIDPAYGAAYSAYEDHFGMLTGNNREAFYELWQEFPIPEAHAKACKLMQQYVAEKRERFYSIPLYEKILRAYIAKEYERIEVDDHASSTDDSIPTESRGPHRTGPGRDRSTEPHVYAPASE